ncbi:hypothetical protein CDD83_4481 [Cordyceps sp. RAO-2017]|nr:hypothetical protein CDD83_4481 [Cordyceps sp. RAO-2017]
MRVPTLASLASLALAAKYQEVMPAAKSINAVPARWDGKCFYPEPDIAFQLSSYVGRWYQFPGQPTPECPGPNYIVQDYTGDIAIVQTSNFKTLFILSRERHLKDSVIEAWIKRAGQLGSNLAEIGLTGLRIPEGGFLLGNSGVPTHTGASSYIGLSGLDLSWGGFLLGKSGAALAPGPISSYTWLSGLGLPEKLFVLESSGAACLPGPISSYTWLSGPGFPEKLFSRDSAGAAFVPGPISSCTWLTGLSFPYNLFSRDGPGAACVPGPLSSPPGAEPLHLSGAALFWKLVAGFATFGRDAASKRSEATGTTASTWEAAASAAASASPFLERDYARPTAGGRQK